MVPLVIKSKIVALRTIVSKLLNLLRKLLATLRNNPAALPGRIRRKTVSIIARRLDVGVMFPHKVRISGSFYPVSHLLPANERTRSNGSDTPAVTVIIPVYRNLDVTRRCIDSVLGCELPASAKVLILNDCSPDNGMRELLDSFKSHPGVEVIHNTGNLGFVRNVNLGMSLAAKSDVVLLNSDTVVSGDWLQRLCMHSVSEPRISSVTATSNNATICSFPVMEGAADWPQNASTDRAQEVLGRQNSGRSVEIPTAVGFCMYITRRSLDALGAFDEAAFGKGYGEENDFCLRGLKAGWKHLQALDVAVFHEGEVSFGASSHPGKERAAQIIRSRYPDYDALIADFAAQDPGRAYRLGALLSMLADSPKPVELICTHIHGGGVAKAVQSFIEAHRKAAHFLTLQRSDQKGFYKLSILADKTPFVFEFSARYAREVFSAALKLSNVSRIHIHHVMDFDTDMLALIEQTTLPFDFYVHDYWTICPQVTLTTAEGVYCGEPSAEVCNRCIALRGERTHAPLASGLPQEINAWRGKYDWLFKRAQNVIVPSEDVAIRMKKYHPDCELKVIYHEPQQDLAASPVNLRPISSREKLKVAVLGSIGVHKGLHRISELEGAIIHRDAPVDLQIIGATDPLLQMANPVKTSGPYNDLELDHLLTKEGIHVIWFPEGAPETYSYTLSHAMRLGYPIIAPKIGAFPERLKGRKFTTMTDLGLKPDELLNCFIAIRESISTALRKEPEHTK